MEPTHAPLTAEHLRALGELADAHHAWYTRDSPHGGRLDAWAERRVGVVLVQDAARHVVRPDGSAGVSQLEVWTFYAAVPGQFLRTRRGESHRDDDTPVLPEYDALPLTGHERSWSAYEGRRVDFFARELDVQLGAGANGVIASLRSWLGHGARQPCRHGTKTSAAHWLSHGPVVWIGTPATRDEAGRVVWDPES